MNGLDGITPEQLQSILELGGLDDQDAQLTESLQRALALQQPSDAKHTTAAGYAIAGLGNLLNAGMGASEETALRAEQKRVAKQRLAGRRTYADALFGRTMPQPPMEAAPFGYTNSEEAAPQTPFGYSPYKPGPLR